MLIHTWDALAEAGEATGGAGDRALVKGLQDRCVDLLVDCHAVSVSAAERESK